MDQNRLLEALAEHRIVPVVTVDTVDQALPLADALAEGGLPVIEVTFRTAAAADVISILKRERPNMLVGAGTVLSTDTLKLAMDRGAEFGVAPGINHDVVAMAVAKDFAFIPGVVTPSEIEQAMAAGCRILKFFPAEASGGAGMIKAISGPFAHTGLRIMPSGGVSVDNMAGYLAQSMVVAVGGTWLATKDDLAQGNWTAITKRCRAARELAL